MKKLLWPLLVAVLLVLLLVIGGIAIAKNMGNGSKNTESESTSTESEVGTGTETETDTESETVTETETETESELPPPDHAEGVELIAIFGVDSRKDQLGKGTRSDSIMVLSVNHNADEVKVVSIYRDTLLYHNYNGTVKGYKKISNAHSYFGPEGAMTVLNQNFDLNITKFITVNFGALTQMVDLIGGVEIELSQKEIDEINKTCSNQLTEPGTHLLDGQQALAFSRIRKLAGSDYKRTERQREVLFEIFEKSKSLGTVKRVQLVETMLEEINTNYKEEDILALLYYISEYEIVEMTAYPQVMYSGIVGSSWVEVPCSLIDMNRELHRILLGESEYTPSEKVQEINDYLHDKASVPNIDQRD